MKLPAFRARPALRHKDAKTRIRTRETIRLRLKSRPTDYDGSHVRRLSSAAAKGHWQPPKCGRAPRHTDQVTPVRHPPRPFRVFFAYFRAGAIRPSAKRRGTLSVLLYPNIAATRQKMSGRGPFTGPSPAHIFCVFAFPRRLTRRRAGP